MKKDRKTAIRVLDNREDAENMLKTLDDKHYLEIRKGEDVRCNDYCRVNKWCEYYNNKQKELKNENKNT
jgi:hypothetical protein